MKRILSTVLAVIILLNLFTVLPITVSAQEADPAVIGAEVDTADTSAAYSADWRLWSQGASDYAIMRSYGCWVVAMSKMFRQSEIATDINPDDFYWWERNNGYLPNNDYNLNQVDGAQAPVAFAASRGKTLNLVTVNNSPSTNNLWSYINSGYYTIIKVNASYDHYVYIENSSSKAQGDIRILESFNNQNEVGSYSLAERYGGAVTAYVYRYITDYEYNLHDDGTVEITKYNGQGGDITIPKYLGGYLVTSIGQYKYMNYQEHYIDAFAGEEAFVGCKSLTSVTIPDSVTTIGAWAFQKCTSLTSVSIPNSVTTICYQAFVWCENLAHITLPNSVTDIGDHAFTGCTNLMSVNISDSVTTTGDWTFEYCENLTSVTIPDSVTTIGNGAFFDCTSLTSVTIPNSVTTIGYEAFWSCTSLTSVTIPNTVTIIDSGAFSDCTSLTSVTIPNSVTYIGDYAFGYWADNYNKINGFTIFGVEGSEAERYANDNDFKFMKITEKTDGDTGIIIYAPEDVSVKSQVIDLAEEAAVRAVLTTYGLGTYIAAYDITMWLYDEIIQPDAPVPVSIPCDNEKTKVYRQEENGALTDMNATYEDGYMVFYTDHFSTYILAVPEIGGALLGDADGDGDVTSIDVTYIQRYSAGLPIDADEVTLMNGDVDGNGLPEIIDATFIQRRLVGMPVPYPVGEPIEA